MSIADDQVIRFIDKHTPSLERIERIYAIGIMLDAQGDEQGARDIASVVALFTSLRHLRGRPTEPKMGGMDRVGI